MRHSVLTAPLVVCVLALTAPRTAAHGGQYFPPSDAGSGGLGAGASSAPPTNPAGGLGPMAGDPSAGIGSGVGSQGKNGKNGRGQPRTGFELRGEQISEGDKVALWYIAANHDPDVYADPHTFDVRRSPNEHEAFGGGGPHFCLGTHLAKLEITVMFEELMARIPDMELSGDVERLRSNFINGIKHMPVQFSPAARAAA